MTCFLGHIGADSSIALPQGTSVISADTFGYSAWTVTAKINATNPNGAQKSYFLKVWLSLSLSLNMAFVLG